MFKFTVAAVANEIQRAAQFTDERSGRFPSNDAWGRSSRPFPANGLPTQNPYPYGLATNPRAQGGARPDPSTSPQGRANLAPRNANPHAMPTTAQPFLRSGHPPALPLRPPALPVRPPALPVHPEDRPLLQQMRRDVVPADGNLWRHEVADNYIPLAAEAFGVRLSRVLPTTTLRNEEILGEGSSAPKRLHLSGYHYSLLF